MSQREWCAQYMGTIYQRACNAPLISLDIPIYDVDSLCGKIADRRYRDSCLKSEQSAYDQIKAFWPDASEFVKRNTLVVMQGLTNTPGVNETYPYKRMLGWMTRFYEINEAQRPAEPFRQ
jgi:hypothetical protein